MNGEFRITTWHGEHLTLFYVIHSLGSGDWKVMGTFKDRPSAGRYIQELRDNA